MNKKEGFLEAVIGLVVFTISCMLFGVLPEGDRVGIVFIIALTLTCWYLIGHGVSKILKGKV